MTKGNAYRCKKKKHTTHTSTLTQLHGHAFSNGGKRFCSNVHCHMQMRTRTRELTPVLKKKRKILVYTILMSKAKRSWAVLRVEEEPMRGSVEWSRLVRRADMMENSTSQFDQSALEQRHYTRF